ncbi:glycosyltransferase family 4 protein [Enterocloster clostridioformis]|uniref:glycosyltransferase family 4 protein n=1 Tax=Enterocloster clostridioformis TaxID=1531 RepID=UPI0003F5BDD3|nr:glycosyltransferase family 4 protein [Enterocloster clostridioformis]
MNVLFIGHEKNLNGASRSMINLIDELSDRCNFTVVLPYKEGAVIDALRKRSIDPVYVPFRRWVQVKDNNFWIKKLIWKFIWSHENQRLARKTADIIRDKKIDIIHTNSIVVDMGYRYSKILGIPHIWHAREMGAEDFGMYPLGGEAQFRQIVSSRENHIVCISKAVMNKYDGFTPQEQLHLIYNGVGVENLNPNKHYFPKKVMTCIQAASIQKAKGQDISIQAIKELRKRGIKNVVLLLAGRGTLDSLGVTIDDTIGITLLGQVNNLPEIRNNADVEIVASRAEAFGRVTVEAMMSGNPVIGSASGGTIELISDKENGLLFEPGNVYDLADKLQYLYEHQEEIGRMGRNAYRYSKDYFSIKRCAEDVYNLYSKILFDGRRQR